MPLTNYKLLVSLILAICPCFSADEDNNGLQPGGSILVDLQNYTADSAKVYSQIEVIPGDAHYTLDVTNIPQAVSFIIIQAHSYIYNVTLSYSYELSPKYHINGTNIGLVYFITKSSMASTFLINLNKFDVTTMVAVTTYRINAPIPGGCNMVFPTSTAPYLNLSYNSAMITVSGQPSMAPENVRSNSCNSPSSIKYQMYHLYMTEMDFTESTYFEAIGTMLTPEGASAVGRKVSMSSSGQIQGVFGAYHGTGSIYTITVQSKSGISSYVPIHTFSCDMSHKTDSCQIVSSTVSYLQWGLSVLVGAVLCFCGHAMFDLEMMLMGSISCGVVLQILFNLFSQEPTDDMTRAVGIAPAFGLLWYFMWVTLHIPALFVLIPLLNLGFMVASIIFFTGVTDEPLFENDFNYWTIFIAIILTTVLILIMTPRLSNIKSCAIIGGYAFILPIDIYAGTNLKYILLNVIHRATVEGFEAAKTSPPFQTPDIILTVVWILLAVCGFFYQLKLTLGRPPFPPPNRFWFVRSHSEATTPLLSEARFSHYSPGTDNVFHA